VAKKKTFKARLVVDPRPEILDPQGKAIHGALERNGYSQVHEVRAGKTFQIELEATTESAARKALVAMGEKLLANPLIETFEIDHLEEAGS